MQASIFRYLAELVFEILGFKGTRAELNQALVVLPFLNVPQVHPAHVGDIEWGYMA